MRFSFLICLLRRSDVSYAQTYVVFHSRVFPTYSWADIYGRVYYRYQAAAEQNVKHSESPISVSCLFRIYISVSWCRESYEQGVYHVWCGTFHILVYRDVSDLGWVRYD